MGIRRIILSGGEPTTKKGFSELLSYATEIGLKVGFITNGYNLTEKMIPTIAKAKPYAIGFSMDGLMETHNHIRQNETCWSNLLKSISAVQATGTEVSIVTTVSRMNLAELPQLAEFLHLIEVTSWQIQLAMPAGRMQERESDLLTQDEFKVLCRDVFRFRKLYPNLNIVAADCFGVAPTGSIRPKEWTGCGAGISSLGIDASGNILPCLSIREDLSCGNVRTHDLKQVWESNENFPFARSFSLEMAKGGTCENCDLLISCRGGCISQSLSTHSRLHSSPFCYHRSFTSPEGR